MHTLSIYNLTLDTWLNLPTLFLTNAKPNKTKQNKSLMCLRAYYKIVGLLTALAFLRKEANLKVTFDFQKKLNNYFLLKGDVPSLP